MTPPQAQAIQAAVLAWAGVEPRVRAIALVGSWARGEAQPGSDIDLMLLADGALEPAIDWAAHGFQLIGATEEVYGIARSRRLRLAPEAEVELTFAPTSWAARPLDAGTRRVVDGGIVVLLDRGGLLAGL